MRYKNLLRGLSTFGLVLMLYACPAASGANASNAILSAKVLASGQQCLPAPESWTATWIESKKTLHRFISRCRAARLGVTSATIPGVDFDRYRVLALEMGQQSSSGYGFDLKRVTAVMESQTAVVGITCHHPPPGAITAQVLTSPWILIRLPIGPYHRIRMVDQNNRQLAQITLPSP